MDFSELKEYLKSQQRIQKFEDIAKFLPPKKVTIGDREVYLFNYTIDAKNRKFIEDSIVITQQPYHSHIPVHVHEFIELTYVFQGKCHVLIDNHRIKLTEGSFLLIDQKTPHTVEDTSEEDVVLSITLKKDYLSPSFLSRLSSQSVISNFLVDSLMQTRKSNRFLIFNSGKNRKIIEIINQIVSEYFDKRIYSDEIINSYFIILFSELIRENEITQRDTTSGGVSSYSLIDYLQYIEDHYQSCNLTTMAKHFSFHPNYLSNLLKKGTGKSFKDLLQIQKISKAAMILVNSDLPIPDIVEEVGYSSVTFFYKKFKQIFGMTPVEYRKKHQKNAVK